MSAGCTNVVSRVTQPCRAARSTARRDDAGRLSAIGAVAVLDYRQPDWPQRVISLTGEGADAAVPAERPSCCSRGPAAKLALIVVPLSVREKFLIIPNGRGVTAQPGTRAAGPVHTPGGRARAAWLCLLNVCSVGNCGPGRPVTAYAATSVLRGRPRARLCGTMAPCISNSPPQTPQGSLRSSAPARQAILALHPRHMAFACPTSCGDSAKNSSGSCVHGTSNPTGHTAWPA